MSKKYQAVVFDLDGTAIPNAAGGTPSRRLIRTMKTYRDRIHLIAATGRPVFQAMPVINALGLTNPCIILGGTTIIDPTTGAIIQRTTLPSSSVWAVLALLKSSPHPIYIRGEHAKDEHFDKSTIGHDKTISEAVDMVCVEGVSDQEFPELKAQFEAIPRVVVTSAPSWGTGHFVMLTHRDATKEHAVARVLQRLNVAPEAAIGVGDAHNDTHLFAAVGLKVAMGNASDELKAAADIIAPSVDEDGLADIIERYGR